MTEIKTEIENETPIHYRKSLVIVDSIIDQIRSGVIPMGKPFMNREEICERYSVSTKTAHRIQKILCERNFIAARNGRSFIVCDPSLAGYVPLNEVLLISQVPTFDKPVIGDDVARGAFNAAKKHHLACRQIFLELLDKHRDEIDPSGSCDPGQGLVLFPYRSIMVRGAGYFLKPGLRRVTIHFPLPFAHHVTSDIFYGIDQLLTRACELGAQSVLLTPLNTGYWDPLTDSEKLYYGRIKARQLGMCVLENTDPNLSVLAEMIRKQRPDAILFTSCFPNIWKLLPTVIPDDPGYRPLKLTFQWGKRLPDDFILYHVDQEDIGYAAVELLADSRSVFPYALTRYIKGKLIENR